MKAREDRRLVIAGEGSLSISVGNAEIERLNLAVSEDGCVRGECSEGRGCGFEGIDFCGGAILAREQAEKADANEALQVSFASEEKNAKRQRYGRQRRWRQPYSTR